jgi:hypothetical protein
MKRVIIRNLDGIQTHGAEMLDPQSWIDEAVAQGWWGKAERWVPASETHDEADVIERESRELQPAIEAVLELVEPAVEAKEAVLDDEGNVVEPAVEAKEAVYKEVSPAVPAVVEEWVKLRAEYTIEIEDISAKLEQDRINREALEYLASTDWLIIRELDAGIPCPADVKEARSEARSRIVR